MGNSISVSMHIGSDKNAIKTMADIKRCDLHNNRKYKNIKNLEKYMEVKEKRIWLLYKLDFLILFVYCFLSLFSKLNKVIGLNIFVFY